MSFPVPSISLLRAFSRPSASAASKSIQCQTRSASSKFPNFAPRHKYAQVNRLDKLHRQQKKAMKQEKEESHTRAALLEQSLQPDASTANSKDLPFHMSRTGTKNLPVYETVKAGGSKHITQIRKLSGDLQEMQRQLREVLQLPEITVDKKGRKKEPVMINQLTQQIVVKGWRGPEVKKWAEMVGF